MTAVASHPPLPVTPHVPLNLAETTRNVAKTVVTRVEYSEPAVSTIERKERISLGDASASRKTKKVTFDPDVLGGHVDKSWLQ